MKIYNPFSNFKMNTHHGGLLPVYSGRRYQRGGGILSSIARFVLPTAKKMLTETVKAAPKVIDSIVNKKQSAKISHASWFEDCRHKYRSRYI